MPEAYPARVSSFTSEDKVYPASNLLKSSSFSKWQSEKGGTKQEAVELSFERPVEISRLDIGNNGSAFVEVLVRRSASSDEPTVFLPSSSFMSPVEAKNGTNLNRVRVFSGNQLLSTVSSQKWDTFRFVCTQPFNKNLQYGLSFVSFHSPAPASPSRQLSNLAKTTGLHTTNCILTEEEEDATAFQPGALFRASKTVVASDTVDTSLQKLVSASTSRDNTSFGRTTASPVIPVKQPATPVSRIPSERTLSEDRSNRVTPGSFSSTAKCTPSVSVVPSSPRPLSGVVFSISGYQNPLRSELRRKALDLGANFRQNWTSDCTHLICAFANTPKFKEVRGKGIIVSDKWIEECHRTRTKVNWRPYRVGRAPSPPVLTVESAYASDANGSESSTNSAKESEVFRRLPKRKRKDDDEEWNPGSSDPGDQNDDDEMDVEEEVESETAEGTDSEDVSRHTRDKRRKVTGNHPKSEGFTKPPKMQRYQPMSGKLNPSEEDTDDEIERVIHPTSGNAVVTTSTENPSKEPCSPATGFLTELPDIFEGKHFFVHAIDIPDKEDRLIRRLIVAFAGKLHPYMHPDVEFVVTRSKWNTEFDDALKDNSSLIFVRPDWLFACDQRAKWVPYQKFLIVG